MTFRKLVWSAATTVVFGLLVASSIVGAMPLAQVLTLAAVLFAGYAFVMGLVWNA